MATRSAIAFPTGDDWRGRYVHSDGYPTWNGRVIIELVRRDGLERVLQTICHDHYGWSSLNGEGGELSSWNSDGRFAPVEGYGIAYTTEQGQSSPNEWVTAFGDDWGTEWAYVLRPAGVMVLENNYAETGYHWTVRDDIPFDAPDYLERLDRAEKASA